MQLTLEQRRSWGHQTPVQVKICVTYIGPPLTQIASNGDRKYSGPLNSAGLNCSDPFTHAKPVQFTPTLFKGQLHLGGWEEKERERDIFIFFCVNKKKSISKEKK